MEIKVDSKEAIVCYVCNIVVTMDQQNNLHLSEGYSDYSVDWNTLSIEHLLIKCEFVITMLKNIYELGLTVCLYGQLSIQAQNYVNIFDKSIFILTY